MKNFIKKLLRFYWHHAQAYSLLTLPINGLGAFSSVLLLLNVAVGVKFSGWIYLVMFLSATIILSLAGVVARKSGLISYWTSLTNSQNEELLEILKKVKENKQDGK